MRKLTISTLAGSVLLAFTALAAQAQPASAPAATPGVDQRQANQEKRIDNGIAKGSLTKREQHRLNREQNAIDKAENKAKSDGTVTKAERKRLHKMQNRASRDIHKQKHDAQAPAKP
jgi:hypothetical protein